MPIDLMRRFAVRKDGVAAVEFALVFPVVVLVVVGISDLVAASKIDRDLKRASASVAHLATLSGNFDSASKTMVKSGLTTILGESGEKSYRVRVEGIRNDGGTLQVDWIWEPFGPVTTSVSDNYFKSALPDNRGGVVVHIEQDFPSFFETSALGEFTLKGSHAATSATSSRIISK